MKRDDENGAGIPFLAVFYPLAVAFAFNQPGLTIGWSATLPKIQADNSTSFEVSENDVKWFVSMSGITGMICILAAGPIIEYVGPRRILLWLQIPIVLLWLMKAFAPHLIIMYLARIGLSMILTFLGSLCPLLTCEMSDPKFRGFTLTMMEIVMTFWLLIMYIMAKKLYWVTTTAIASVPAAILFVIYLFVPESPYWLARYGQMEEAERSLYKLRVSKEVAAQEFEHLCAGVKGKPETGARNQIRQLKYSRNFCPVLLLTAIFILREMGGEYVIFSYTVYIFEKTGVEIDPFTSTVIVGVIRLLFTILSSLFSDRIGRRPLLIGTCLVCAMSSAVFGLSFILKVPGSSWLCLSSLLVYVASYGFGLGPIPWGLAGEMIPTPVRAVGGSISIFGYGLSVFVMGYLYPVFVDRFDIGYTFLIFSVSLFMLSVIFWVFFVETKGKLLSDLQDAFQRTENEQVELTTSNTLIHEKVAHPSSSTAATP